jgi:hypothetical protein
MASSFITEDRPAGKSLGEIKKFLGQDDDFPHTDESMVRRPRDGDRFSGAWLHPSQANRS